MNTLVKITIPLLILITMIGCVRHSGHYSAYPDDYYYDRGGYNSYYSNPVYYDRHVYVQPRIYNDRQNSHRRPHYNYPNRPQKPNRKHGYNNEYQQSSKPNIKRPIRRNNARFGEDRYVNKNNLSNKSYKNYKKPSVNNSFPSSGKGTKRNRSSNYSRTQSYPTSGKSSKGNSKSSYSRSQPTSSGSKFGKSRNTFSPQRQHSGGKSSKK